MTNTDHNGKGEPGYEKRDVNAPAIYVYGALLLIFTVLCMAFINWLFDTMKYRSDAGQVPPLGILSLTETPSSPQPAFPMYPARKLAEFRQAEDRHLDSYGWLDRQAGVGHIPVDRAMDLMIQQGLPPVPPPESSGEDTP